MDSHEIAKWVREEHAKVTELADELRRLIAVVPRVGMKDWLGKLRERFDHFRAHNVRHMALEEQEGYMRFVLERRPTLSDEADRLKHEHKELMRIMDNLHGVIEKLEPEDRLIALDCSRRIEDLLSYVDHHEKEESLLVTFVHTQDIGAND